VCTGYLAGLTAGEDAGGLPPSAGPGPARTALVAALGELLGTAPPPRREAVGAELFDTLLRVGERAVETGGERELLLAVELADKALTLRAKSRAGWRLRAHALDALGRAGAATEAYERQLSLGSTHPETPALLAAAREKRECLAAAVGLFPADTATGTPAGTGPGARAGSAATSAGSVRSAGSTGGAGGAGSTGAGPGGAGAGVTAAPAGGTAASADGAGTGSGRAGAADGAQARGTAAAPPGADAASAAGAASASAAAPSAPPADTRTGAIAARGRDPEAAAPHAPSAPPADARPGTAAAPGGDAEAHAHAAATGDPVPAGVGPHAPSAAGREFAEVVGAEAMPGAVREAFTAYVGEQMSRYGAGDPRVRELAGLYGTYCRILDQGRMADPLLAGARPVGVADFRAHVAGRTACIVVGPGRFEEAGDYELVVRCDDFRGGERADVHAVADLASESWHRPAGVRLVFADPGETWREATRRAVPGAQDGLGDVSLRRPLQDPALLGDGGWGPETSAAFTVLRLLDHLDVSPRLDVHGVGRLRPEERRWIVSRAKDRTKTRTALR
jgi:hypothetical protein